MHSGDHPPDSPVNQLEILAPEIIRFMKVFDMRNGHHISPGEKVLNYMVGRI